MSGFDQTTADNDDNQYMLSAYDGVNNTDASYSTNIYHELLGDTLFSSLRSYCGNPVS